MHAVFRSQKVGKVEVFYRETGPADGSVILLLHGFPTASHLFRDLIPELASQYRVIASDLPGFGNTAAPPRGAFTCSFDGLAEVMAGLVDALGLARYARYIFDHGAPAGIRLAMRSPERVAAIVTRTATLTSRASATPAASHTIPTPWWRRRHDRRRRHAECDEAVRGPRHHPITMFPVNDDAPVLANTAVVSRDVGHTVPQAASAGDALAALREEPMLDILVTDEAMPNMRGLQLAEAVRPRYTHTSVLLVSGNTESTWEVDLDMPRLDKPLRRKAWRTPSERQLIAL